MGTNQRSEGRAGWPAGVSDADLDALRDKYSVLVALRQQREDLERRGILRFEGAAAEQRRTQMRRLARRFPGALRELDVLDAAELEARRQAIETLLVSRRPGEVPGQDDVTSPAPLWVRVALGFHFRARALLAIRRWVAKHGSREAKTEALLEPLRRWLAQGPVGSQGLAGICSRLDVECLERILHPPGGRLMDLVWDSLAEELGVGAGDLRALIYGPRRA